MSTNEILGMGTASLTSMKLYSEAIRLLEMSYNLGIRHFDTAPLYGKGFSEVIVGDFLKSKRSEVEWKAFNHFCA